MHETAKAAAAFAEYCALGAQRSLEKLVAARVQNGTKARLASFKQWSSEHGWQERVKDYDRKAAEARRQQREAAIEEMNARHVGLAKEAQQVAQQQIKTLIAARSFGSQATVQLLKLGIDAERLALGAATERSELTGMDGAPFAALPQAQVVVWIPDNGRDGYGGQPAAQRETGEG